MKVLGIDFGTTSFGGCIYDTRDETTSYLNKHNPSHKTAGLKREFDMEKARMGFYTFIESLHDTFGLSEIEAVSVTGNMHSFFLVRNGKPITDITTWQDERVLEKYRDGLSYVDFINKTFSPFFSSYQHSVSSGYAVSTLLHLLDSADVLVEGSFAGCSIHFAPDFIVQELIGNFSYTGDRAITDHSLAHSSGLYAIENRDWNHELIDALGYGPIRFPRIAEPGTFVGRVGRHVPALQGVPVFLGMGDNQASVFGAMVQDDQTNRLSTTWDGSSAIVISMGTSGQVSAVVKSCEVISEFVDYRPFLDGALLLVGASLSCGKTMEAMKDFVQNAADLICEEKLSDERAYGIITNCILPDSPLEFRTTLNGTRYRPDMRGSVNNIDLANLTMENLITAAAYGVVEELHQYYKEMHIDCDRIIGVGNGLRRNRFFVEIIKKVFDKNVCLSEIDEAASFGAAMCAVRGLLHGGLLSDEKK